MGHFVTIPKIFSVKFSRSLKINKEKKEEEETKRQIIILASILTNQSDPIRVTMILCLIITKNKKTH